VQFPEDAGAMAHPVRPDSYVEINNFYTPTIYEKGAEVVRMMQSLVGRAGFERGITLYFQRHDGQAVTCDDFAQAIADANPGSELARRLPQFKRWYGQAGTPRLTARGRYDAPSRTFTLGLEQSPAPTAAANAREPFVIPLAMGLLSRDGRPMSLRLEDEPESASAKERLLVLDEHRAFFTFVDVDEAPVPSLLRGFSAPVCLLDGLGDAELVILLRHDRDPFNRWEAGQRLALNRLLAAIAADTPESPLDEAFVEATRTMLREPSLDPAFKALALTLPSETWIAEQIDSVDPQRVHAAREAMKRQLATALFDDWQRAFDAHQVKGGYSPDPVSAGRRALANLSLMMLCLAARQSGDAVWPGRAWQRFKEAGNMTDRQGALISLLDSGSVLADAALERFHAMFRNDPLALDKWFALQAGASEHEGRVFERARRLLSHPDFHLSNPNRARSLIGMLCLHNPAAFHRVDGAGYAFWAERVIALDAINPQLASRMARALDRWSHLAEPYRSAARAAIERVSAQATLSDDTQEIVSRALAGA
jgi:aminopeptidase N